jgi:outer membrane receptor protein involved in Fe transport
MRRVVMAALLASLWAGAALAQAAPEDAGDIIVTAQRREQRLQDVGIAVTAVTREALAQTGAQTVSDIERLAPGLEIEQALGGGQPQFRLRGVGFEDYATNNTPTVGVYQDEVAFPIPAGTQGLLFDLDRAEVLRGPQGTLYGRNTTGGAINLVTGRPTDALSAGASVEYGNLDLLRAEGFVSGGLTEAIRVRLAAATLQGGGFQQRREDGRRLGDQDIVAVRAKIALGREDGPFSVLLGGQYNRDRSEGRGVYLFNRTTPPVAGQPAFGPDRRRDLTGWGLSPSFAAILGYPTDQKPLRDNDTWVGWADVRLDLGFATLTSITAYQALNRIELNDWAALSLGNSDVWFRSKANVFSQETRLSGGGDGFVWTAGVYYSRERLNEIYRSDFLDAGFFLSAFTPYRQRVRSIAGFGQVEYALSDRLNLVGGLRYEDEDRDLIGLSTIGILANGFEIPFVLDQDRSTGLSELTGKAAVEFKLRPDALLYVSASRGVKSGGFTAVNTLAPQQVDPFQPETLWAYEAGFKADFADRRVRLNGAAFYYDYRDQQVQGVVLSTVGGVTTRIGRITNAPRSRIWGIELEGVFRIGEALTLTQTLGYKQGEYRRFLDPDLSGNIVDRAGQDIGFPRFSLGGEARWVQPLGAFELTPAFSYSYRDDSTLAVLRSAGDTYRVDDYWLVDASVALAPRGGRWEAALFARNLTDTGYDEARNFFIGGFDIAAPGRPRTWGGRVSLRY